MRPLPKQLAQLSACLQHTKQLIYFLETVETDQDYQELKVKANFRKEYVESLAITSTILIFL
jgi:septation ring formation regulator EzrA